MILPQLLWRFLRHRDDPVFYEMQATDAIRWLRANGVATGPGTTALDLGCGHGVFGGALAGLGCEVTFADASDHLLPAHRGAPFVAVDLDRDGLAKVGRHDLVVCSNVLEHLARPERLLHSAHEMLTDRGVMYLSWTNWLSPWGGHETSPWHYFGGNYAAQRWQARHGSVSQADSYRRVSTNSRCPSASAAVRRPLAVRSMLASSWSPAW